MAAHRYWRVQPIQQASGQTGYGEIVFAASVGGLTLLGSGTPSASATYGGSYAPFSACDGNTASNWFGTGRFDWWQYDFGAGNSVNVNEVRIAGAYEDTSPQAFLLQSSDDGSTFADEYYGINPSAWVRDQYVSFARPAVTTNARYQGLYCYLNGNNTDADILISQLAFASTTGGADLCAPGQAYIGLPLGNDFSTVFNGSTSGTAYYYAANTTHTIIIADLGAATFVKEGRITTTTDTSGSNYNRAPSQGLWLASNDGKAYWKTNSFSAGTWSPGQTQSFIVSGTPPTTGNAQANQLAYVAPTLPLTQGQFNQLAFVYPAIDIPVPSSGANFNQFALVSVSYEYVAKIPLHGYTDRTVWAFPLLIQKGLP